MSAAKILIAEDDAMFRHELAVMLTRQGYEAICVEDGCQAVEYAVREKPDLFLLDVHMPAGDGYSVARRLQRLHGFALTPIIFMSHDAIEKIESMAKKHHPAAIFNKPLVHHELLLKIREVLAGQGADGKCADEDASDDNADDHHGESEAA